jgi:type III restriction enzyme
VEATPKRQGLRARGARRGRHRAAGHPDRPAGPHPAHPPQHRPHPDESGRLDDFKRNPQQFIELAAEAINRCKRLALVDGIKYQRIGDEEYYAQELFEQEELTGYLKNMLDAEKSVYEQVVYDSDTERTSPSSWRRTRPSRSTPSCPAGSRCPRRWAPTTPTGPCWSNEDGTERLYFVVETKSSLFTDDLRDKESAKIECGISRLPAPAIFIGRIFLLAA